MQESQCNKKISYLALAGENDSEGLAIYFTGATKKLNPNMHAAYSKYKTPFKNRIK